jgi:hypothetical protein
VSQPLIRFVGFVTCVAVDGDRAAIGAVGQQETFGTPLPNRFAATGLFALVDGGPTGEDEFDWDLQPGSTPPDCSTASFENVAPGGPDEAYFVVNDAASTGRAVR